MAIALEAAGVPVPGETSLIAATVGLAGYLLGRAALAVVSRYHWLATAGVLIAIAAGGAIVWWGRRGR